MLPKTSQPIKIFFRAGLTLVLFCLIIWLSTAATVALLHLAQQAGGPLGTFLVDKGAERLMRRLLLFWLIIILLFSLKKFGWRGGRDCGWTQDDPALSAGRGLFFGLGLVFGFITLGTMAVLTTLTGVHRFKEFTENIPQIGGELGLFALAGLAVALIEETICRGMLFRVLARAWRRWPAAVITSLLFAAAHFIGPPAAAFQGESFSAVTLNATRATLASFLPPERDLVQFINLALLGVVLCGLVMRTGTIWMGVGAHAMWVFIIKLHAHFTELNPAAPDCLWLGKRNDFMDALGTALLLAMLILLLAHRKRKTGWPLKINRQTWYGRPAELENLASFSAAGEKMFADAELLKTYAGCRVSKKSGLILKQYWPKGGLDACRFALRPRRGRRAFLLAADLIAQGLPTPPVLAWTARRRCGLLRSEAALVREIRNAEQLTAWLARNSADAAARRKVMAAYGELMAAFHRHGYSNRDLKHENVMCEKEAPWALWVVDLDGVRRQIFITRGRAGRDLMRVGKSLAALGWSNPADLAAFFEAYNQAVPPRLQRHSFPD